MSQVRKQSIISSIVVYIGFAIGFFNTYLFTRKGSGISPSEYGLIGIFIAVASLMSAFASLGMPSYIYKFYPYYKDNLPVKKNDQLSWALLFSIFGFGLVTIAGYWFKDLVIRKFGSNSPDFVKYYNLIFPFGFGLTLFLILEAYAWQLRKSVLTNFLKEILFRLLTTILIILISLKIIPQFDFFIKSFTFFYFVLTIILLLYLFYKKEIFFTLKISKVTKKFYKKILILISFVYGGGLVYTISYVFDTIVIAALMPNGLVFAGIYTLAQNITSLIQAPQRGILSSATPALSRAWKDKNLDRIDRIYKSTSINQLIFALGMFALIWLNFNDGIFTFKLKNEYFDAKWVFFYIGMMRIVDMGTGVNGQIIGTSTLWRFDFISGIILLILTLPFNYLLTKKYGVTGPAISNLVSTFIYNAIRYWYLIKKYNLQPFTSKTLLTILIGAISFLLTYFLFHNFQGIWAIFFRSISFILFYGGATVFFKLSPDVAPVWQTIKNRLKINKL